MSIKHATHVQMDEINKIFCYNRIALMRKQVINLLVKTGDKL